MNRKFVDYSERVAAGEQAKGFDASVPVAGYYRFRKKAKAVRGVVKIWYGPPHDPVTGEELDRGWRWQANFNGDPIDIDYVWPSCAGEPADEDRYLKAIERQNWAKANSPESSYANPDKPRDPLGDILPF